MVYLVALKLRELRADEVAFTLHCHHEDLPVRGNAMASGDDKFDREVEDEIIRRLKDGGIWAWCAVTVEAKWQSFTGEDHLGGCSYASEEEFKTGGYYENMKKNALESLNNSVTEHFEKLKDLIQTEDPA